MIRIDLQTTMDMGLILKITDKTPDEIRIIIPKDDEEIIVETLKMEKPLNKISMNGPWSNILKSKIKKGYVKLGKSEAVATPLIKEGFFDAITELQYQNMQNMEHAKDMAVHEEERSLKEEVERIQLEAEQFKQYLRERNATVMDFLEFVSEWLLSGESKNIQTVFFAHFSTLTGLRPVWTIILGGPGEGKTAIEEAGRTLVPKRFVYSGRATYAYTLDQAEYLGANFLDRCIIGMKDLGGKNSYIKWEETLDIFKELSTEGEYDYKKMADTINPETKKRENIHIIITGKPSVSLASTHSDGLTGQYISRGITLTPMGSDDDVLRYRRYTRPGTFALEFRENLLNEIMGLFHSYLEDLLMKIETVEVINPYFLCLEQWFKKSANNKRASEMFPLLVDAVTLFNYEKRHTITSPNGKTYYMATKEDNETIANLFDITPGLTAEVVAFYNKIVKAVGRYDYDEFELYQDGKKDIKQCKTIFTVGTLKNQRLRKSSPDEKAQFSDFCHLLHDTGKLDSLMKNHKGHHVYCLNNPKPLGTADIEFVESLIKKYLEEDLLNQDMGMRLSEAEIMPCMNDEVPQKSINKTFVSPPWDTFQRGVLIDSKNILGSSENEAQSESYNSK